MRTLKKTLALVLVLAMVLGLGVTANAAFTDADEIENTLEVDTMVALGVLEGMPDGSYDPAGTLTRAQGATMIVRLMGLGDFVDKCATPFTDVPASHWASGYIAYCVEEGILDGYGDGNFGPSDKLTGYQWAKMIVAASEINITVDRNGEIVVDELTGSAWQIKTAKYATQLKLWLGDDSVKTEPITRDTAALVGYNFLIENEQFFLNEYFPGYALEPVDTYDTAYGAPYVAYQITVPNDDPIAVGTYVAEPILTYTKEVTEAKLFKDLKTQEKDTVTFTMYTDGEVAGTAPTFDPETSFDSTDAIDGSANGVLVEVYDVTPADAGKNEYAYRIVVINTYVADITSGMITEAVDATATADGTPAFVTIADMDYVTDEFVPTDDADEVVATVLYTKGNVWSDADNDYVTGIVTLEAIEPASGTVTAIGSDNTFTMGGTKYEYANILIETDDVEINGKSYDVYTDAYGYVVKTMLTPGEEEAPAAANYGYLIGYAAAQPTSATVTDEAKAAYERFQIVGMDGEKAFFDGAFTTAKTGAVTKFVYSGDATAATFGADDATFVSYTLNDDGKIATINKTPTKANTAFTKGEAGLDNKYLTADTAFLYTWTEGEGDAAVTKYASFTGYKTATSFTETTVSYFYDTETSKIAAVFANVGEEPDTSSQSGIKYAYVLSTVNTAVPSIIGTANDVDYQIAAIAGEEPITLTFDSETDFAALEAGVVAYKVDQDGYAELQATETAAANKDAEVSAADANGEYIEAGTFYYMDADTAIYVVDATAKTVTAAESVTLPTGYTVTLVGAIENDSDAAGTIDVIYITIVKTPA